MPPLSWVTSDLEWLGGTVAAFRELIAASTSMAARAQKAADAAHNVVRIITLSETTEIKF